ncbi:pentatricopeptide repeat-containing protein At1g09220, mitochondrial-like [Tasmannia lanceolata]|uniref:pentatricopeptide repeat-containing protein At1g09220, mitochondrial-like n=1 Tax=Tasmannia lanceolata TaxID=3420 RepID=UPI004063B973
MLWLRSPLFNLRTCALNSFFYQYIISLNQSTHSHVLQPSKRVIFSLLHEHQSRNQSKQIHCQLITNGLHHDWMCGIEMVIWNALFREYSQGRYPEEALHLCKQMQESESSFIPMDSFTFSFLLKACANLIEPRKGIQIHGHITKVGYESHVYVQTALVNMYLMCRFYSEAERVFNNMPMKNLVTWNVMITGLTKWGEVDLAGSLFERMPYRNIISWTGMIDGYTRINQPREALTLFIQMMAENVKPTPITILSIIPAISNLGAFDLALSVHAIGEKSCFNASDIRVTNSLIDMYAKCGCIENAFRVFEELSERRNLVSWTSIISALAMHGLAREAIDQFEEMKKVNLRPNQVTFISVLNACSHGGLVEEGLKFFSDMINEHGIVPGIKQYGCMIDMLGRAGRLEEAERMILEMPMKDNVIVWRTLLGACSFHGNSEMGERVMKKIMEMERGYSGDYVLLSNILAGAGRFDDAERVRRCMDERNVLKIPGLALIDGKSRI